MRTDLHKKYDNPRVKRPPPRPWRPGAGCCERHSSPLSYSNASFAIVSPIRQGCRRGCSHRPRRCSSAWRISSDKSARKGRGTRTQRGSSPAPWPPCTRARGLASHPLAPKSRKVPVPRSCPKDYLEFADERRSRSSPALLVSRGGFHAIYCHPDSKPAFPRPIKAGGASGFRYVCVRLTMHPSLDPSRWPSRWLH